MKILQILLIFISINLLGQKVDNCIDKYQHEIKSTDPTRDNSDLSFLSKFTTDKNIVSLGEATHGSSEVFKMKHRIIKYLVEKEDYNIFAIEANMAEAELLNKYIQTGEGEPKKLLAYLNYWVWNTKEVLDLILWLREYNETHEKKVVFTGFDMQSYRFALHNVNNLYPKDNEKIENIVNKLDTINKKIINERKKGIYQINDSLIEEFYNESHLLYSEINLIENKPENYNWLLQNSVLLVQFATRYSKHKPKHGYRDLCMAKNLKWIKDNYKNSKVIIWAHNGHVKRNKYTMGSYMNEEGLEAYVIGFSVYKGFYTAIANGKIAKNELSIPNKDCYEYYFNQSNLPIFFIDLNSLKTDKNCNFIKKHMDFREIGSMKRDEQFYKSNLLKEYDGIINIKETNASELLF